MNPSGFPIDTFGNDSSTIISVLFSVIPDLIGDPFSFVISFVSFCRSQLDWESILFVILHLMRNPPLPSIVEYKSQGKYTGEEKLTYGYRYGYGGIEVCYDYNPYSSERRRIQNATVQKWESILKTTLSDIKERYEELEVSRFAFLSGGSNTKRWWHTSENDWQDWLRNLVYLRNVDENEPINSLEEGKAVVSEAGDLVYFTHGSANIGDIVCTDLPIIDKTLHIRAKSAWTGKKALQFLIINVNNSSPENKMKIVEAPPPDPATGWQEVDVKVSNEWETAWYVIGVFEGEYGGEALAITNPIFFFCLNECCSQRCIYLVPLNDLHLRGGSYVSPI